MAINRRVFIKNSGVAMIGMSTSRIPSARRSRHAHAEQEEARRPIPARRRGWPEHRRAVRRTKLLPHSPDHRDSRATQRRRQGAAVDLDGFFGLHPSLAPLAASFHRRTTCHRSRRRIARHHALAF